MTQKSNHTPGPWKYDYSENANWREISAPNWVQFARVAAPPHALVEGEANARLIAAAPDLLEALKPFASAYRDWDGGNATRHFADSISPADFARAARALAKAEAA